jgi:hypothetical protein
MDLVKKSLGLDQSATNEQVEKAWNLWLNENRELLPGLKAGLHFFKGFV